MGNVIGWLKPRRLDIRDGIEMRIESNYVEIELSTRLSIRFRVELNV
jgi:hypothetical protein